MNKKELVDKIYFSMDGSLTRKECRKMLDQVMEEITEEVSRGEAVRLVNFGTFKPRPRKSTVKVHPVTGKKIDVPAKVTPKFSPGKGFREKVKDNLETKKDGSGELVVEKS